MWCGNNWISDFIQNSEKVYTSFQPPIHYYRYQESEIPFFDLMNACDDYSQDECSNIHLNQFELRNWKCELLDYQCTLVPKSYDNRNIFNKITSAEYKEVAGKNYNTFLEGYYDKYLTEEDIELIKKKNTCSYLSFGAFNAQSTSYEGVRNKNLCFNADQFNELKDLINCGYAEAVVNVNGIIRTINLCSYVPTKNINDELLPYFKFRYIDKVTIDELEEVVLLQLYGNNRRLIDNIYSYEMTVEDKYGKIIKFEKNSDTIEIVEQGHQTDSDKEEVDDDEPSKIKTSSSGYSKLNMILLLSVILMVI
jgi:hypothetical protein